jgi:phage shock protein PspC (stress-responsive transcriptional regulator)
MTSPDEPTQPQPDDQAPRDEPRPEDPRAGEPRPRKLTRSSSDRIIGGVAGGIGRHLGIDPILVRVAFILLCFAGGAGIIAYLALLAFVPSDDGRPVSQTNRTTSVVATVALAVAAVVFLGPPAIIFGPGLLGLALVAVVVVLIYRATGGSEDPARAIARAGLILLAVLAAFGAAVGVGFLAALGGGVVIGILTVVAGLALVVTAFVGGARWLIVPALVLAVPLAIVAAAGIDIRGGIGDRSYHPQNAAEIKPKYELGMGRLDIDMRDAQLPAGQTNIKVDQGVGETRIRVADNVCVTTNADIGVGAVTLFGRDNGGVDVAYAEGGRAVDPTRPVLHIDANLGAGHLDVDRGGFDTTRWWDHARTAHSGVACP